MRTFIGIDFSDELKHELYRIQQKLRKYAIRGRWKHSSNFHLTLKFLNEISDEQKNKIDEAMKKLCDSQKSFNLELKGIGIFNGRDSIRVLWIGLTGEMEILNSLNKKIGEAFAEIGFPAEKKEFNPHITIGQDIILNGDSRQVLESFGQINPGTIKVDKLFLFKSEQIENKRIYSKISEYNLKNY